jgi:hypothetical protein
MPYQRFLLILQRILPYAGLALVRLVERLSRGDENRSAVLLAAAAILLSVASMSRLRAAFERGNWGRSRPSPTSFATPRPSKPTLDGFAGLGLFRPQALLHHFNYPHAFSLQIEEEKSDMMRALRTGRALPKMSSGPTISATE